MQKIINLIRKRFDRLVVIQQIGKNRWGQYLWLCECDCGNKKIIVGNSLKNKDTKSCGCLQKERASICNIKHGHSRRKKWSQIYQSWISMIQRCTNPNNKRYKDYGNRGITICERWRKFEYFLEDMDEPPTNKHQIDRIKNNQGYCKKNCHWVISKINNRNRRDNRLITYRGKTQCLSSWAEQFNINYSTLWYRLYRYKWSIKKVFTVQIRKKKKNER